MAIANFKPSLTPETADSRLSKLLRKIEKIKVEELEEDIRCSSIIKRLRFRRGDEGRG